MQLGLFMQLRTRNMCAKFRVEIPSGCSVNGKQRWGYFFVYKLRGLWRPPQLSLC